MKDREWSPRIPDTTASFPPPGWAGGSGPISAPLLVVAVCMLMVTACTVRRPLDFSVTFKEADGLNTGHPVIYRDVEIGSVRDVELGDDGTVVVNARVDPDYAQRMYREARFKVVKPGGLLDISGQRALEMSDTSGSGRTPIAPGDTIRGVDGWFDRAEESIGEAQRWLENEGPVLLEKAAKWKDSEEGRQLIEGLDELTDRAGELGSEQWEALRDETLPILEGRARELKERLIEVGRSDEAEEMWQRFDQLARRLAEDDTSTDETVQEERQQP